MPRKKRNDFPGDCVIVCRGSGLLDRVVIFFANSLHPKKDSRAVI